MRADGVWGGDYKCPQNSIRAATGKNSREPFGGSRIALDMVSTVVIFCLWRYQTTVGGRPSLAGGSFFFPLDSTKGGLPNGYLFRTDSAWHSYRWCYRPVYPGNKEVIAATLTKYGDHIVDL